MILIVVDAHSKWIEAIPMSTASAQTTIQQLRKLIAQFGIPDTLVSDNGSQFTATEFQEFCRLNGIRHTTVAPYHPSSNGLAERAVRIVKEGLRKLKDGTMTDRLSRILFQYRITPQTTTGMAPAELLIGRRLKSRLDILMPSLDERVRARQSQQKLNHDKKSRAQQFSIDDQVFVRNHAQGDKWLPGVISALSGPVSYRVKLQDSRIIRCHQDQLRPRAPAQPQDPQQPQGNPQIDDYDFIDLNLSNEGNTSQCLTRNSSEESSQPSPETSVPAATGMTQSSQDAAVSDSTSEIPPTSITRKTYPTRTRVQPDWYHSQYC